MRRWLLLPMLAIACEPAKGPSETAPAPSAESAPKSDACRNDIPDCAAACALRETNRRDFLDFYDRRCASVILGHNPDKVVLAPVAPSSAASSPSSLPSDFPPDVRASLMVSGPHPFDPSTMSRIGGSEPAECKAARILRAQHRDRDADWLEALCIAKGGGDAGT